MTSGPRKPRLNKDPKWMDRYKPGEKPEEQKYNKWKGFPCGVWGKLFMVCVERYPNKWVRSHPLTRRASIQPMAWRIRHWDMNRGQWMVGVTPDDGAWEAEYGHDTDDNELEHWYIWVKWHPFTPAEKGARTKAKKAGKLLQPEWRSKYDPDYEKRPNKGRSGTSKRTGKPAKRSDGGIKRSALGRSLDAGS
jgi:hypothetical protein